MANITLPSRIRTLLEKDDSLNGAVRTTLSQFGEILRDNKLYFFEEYTDHGISHMESVLRVSELLITEQTFKDIFSATDAGYYVLSVILHDIGMHIGLDGFKTLLNGSFDDAIVKEFDDKTWSKLWEEYLSEAKRFSGRQLNNLFGQSDFKIEIPPIDDMGSLDANHKKLIGEFLRRHHARLAHEIAIKGFPGLNTIAFAEDIDDTKRNIIGLIARSHGMDLRQSVDYIEKKFGKERRRIIFNCHAPFLMVLLRVSDYLQMESSRTSKVLIKLKSFLSQVSAFEHQKHLDIEEVYLEYQDDPERIFVAASPRDSKTFVSLNRLISSIQYELDLSWAVLGELYGVLEKRPEIRYRRITSNLNDKHLLSSLNYVADSVSFQANNEISKLLIAPLYGDNPSYGIRELLQNAIDACRERELLERNRGIQFEASIVVDIYRENGNFYFKITDNGVGMDVDVIKNYFLSSGSSYRESSEWQKGFTDEEGKSKINRSGRFGVGVLAAFLIGNEIFVRTRKEGNVGYSFLTTLDQEQININIDDIDYGTSICIEISEKTFQILNPTYANNSSDESGSSKWLKWYTLPKPHVEYYYDKTKITSYTTLDPDFEKALPIDWNKIQPEDFESVYWTYSREYSNSELTCNGIVIGGTSYYGINPIENEFNYLDLPLLSVFDKDGYLPLSLDRSRLTRTPTFTHELVTDIYKDFIAYILMNGDLNWQNISKALPTPIRLYYPGHTYRPWLGDHHYGMGIYRDDRRYNSHMMMHPLLAKKGFILNYGYFLSKLNKINVLYIQDTKKEPTIKMDEDYYYMCSHRFIESISDFRSAIEGDYISDQQFNSRHYIHTEKYEYLYSDEQYRVPLWLKDASKLVYQDEAWSIIELGSPPRKTIDNKSLNDFVGVNYIREYQIDLSSYQDNEIYMGDPILNALLAKYIGNEVIIPYDLDERREKYGSAFKELERFMQKYRQ